MAIITTIFGVMVIVISAISNTMMQSNELEKPEVEEWVFEEISPNIDQSFVEDLKARSENSVGIKLEL